MLCKHERTNNAGEEVDIASICVEETEVLVSYTNSIIDNYKNNTPLEVSAVKQRYYNPKVPYFQSLWGKIKSQKEVVIYMLKEMRLSCLNTLDEGYQAEYKYCVRECVWASVKESLSI